MTQFLLNEYPFNGGSTTILRYGRKDLVHEIKDLQAIRTVYNAESFGVKLPPTFNKTEYFTFPNQAMRDVYLKSPDTFQNYKFLQSFMQKISDQTANTRANCKELLGVLVIENPRNLYNCIFYVQDNKLVVAYDATTLLFLIAFELQKGPYQLFLKNRTIKLPRL